jgi:hypothetical protein
MRPVPGVLASPVKEHVCLPTYSPIHSPRLTFEVESDEVKS